MKLVARAPSKRELKSDLRGDTQGDQHRVADATTEVDYNVGDDGWPPSESDGHMPHLDPVEAREVVAEIREIAESRTEDEDPTEAIVAGPASSAEIHVPAAEPAAEPERLASDELRDAWAVLDFEERADGLRLLDREDAEDFFISLPAADQAATLLHWKPGQRRQWLRLLEPDDVADLVQEADEDDRPSLLALLDEPMRKEVHALMAYAEDEAGGLMNTRYARLRPQMTVDEAISYLRRQSHGTLETIYQTYVLDPDQHLLGVLSLRDLFTAPSSKTVADIMETEVVRVSDEMDQETLSRVFAEHDLNVIPVVDAGGVMKGIVTVDDIVDVVQEEATEDAQKFGGMEALDVPYLQASFMHMFKKRGSWLAILLIGEMLTASALGFFQGELEKYVVLALFIPLIISSGGNSGSQASTLVIRAMALGEVRAADWWRVVRREIFTGVALGVMLAVVGSVRVLIWGVAGAYGKHYLLVSFTVATSLVGVVTFGTFAGASLPFVLRKFGVDPASASAPFVATLVDVTGLIIYFTIAAVILHGTTM